MNVEEFRTNIFEKQRSRTRKRFLYNVTLFVFILLAWILWMSGFPLVGFKTAVVVTMALVGLKLYDDKYMGITAYGERKGNLVITEEYLEINEQKIYYSDVSNLVIYVDEYLGLEESLLSIHHGGNNKIEFTRNGKDLAFNYIIKNKQDYDRLSLMIEKVEKDPRFASNLRKL